MPTMDGRLSELRFDDLSSIRCRFFACLLPSGPSWEAIVIAFQGEYGFGCRGADDAAYMKAMIVGADAAWGPDAIILNLRELRYEWGDEMADVLSTAACLPGAGCVEEEAEHAPARCAIVASDLNRDGLTSLVDEELFSQPEDWLFSSLEDAVAATDRMVADRIEHVVTERPPRERSG